MRTNITRIIMNKKRILITGGLGFIGYETTVKLLGLNFMVTVLDNLSDQVHTVEEVDEKLAVLNNYPGFTFIEGSVTDPADCKKALDGADILIHLAAETGTGQSMYEIAKYVNINVNGTAVLLDVMAKNSIKLDRIILSSSRSVYGEGKYQCKTHGVQYPGVRNMGDLKNGIFDPLCAVCKQQLNVLKTDENSAITPLSIYATTKRQQEELVSYAYDILNTPYTIFRYQNVYGAGQSLQNPYTGILSIFSTRILNKKSIEIFEDGEESRDFVYVDDVVNATIMPVLNPSDRNEIINVGTGVPTSVYAVATGIMDVLNTSVELHITGKSRTGDIRHNIADISYLQDVYNYTPAYSFKQGLEKFMAWVLKQPLPNDGYETAILELKQKGLYK